jgi:DNA mismatch repair protein MutS2
LDVIFARAAYACEWNGVIPKVGNESSINVQGFVHPVLALEKSTKAVVPVDLFLPSQVLMISGPNAGGKTLSLKSFGLTACFVKLGIPITVLRKPSEGSEVRVDFFDDIFVQIGDSQDLITGESTLMARLNACSALIHKMETADIEVGGQLVLLDELGGGTDPFAGAAISTAILEKLCTDNMCKIVATTHSPQLKALSLDDERFQSASVLLESQEGEQHEQNNLLDSAKMKPTFKLHYGFATESYPLGAASRCNPALPDDVISRAAELMSKGGGGDEAVEALRRHMIALEYERNSAKKLREEAQLMFNEVAAYKRDMVCKLQTSEGNLSRLEARLQNIYETLKNDETRELYDIVGDGLSSLRLLRKAVKSEEELLSEKGLRRVSDRHSFYDNESVVITAEGEFQWQNAVVRINGSDDSSKDEDTITVVPSLDLAFGEEDSSQTLLLVRRKDVAVWDIPDADWGFQDDAFSSTSYSGGNKPTSNVLEKLKQVSVGEKKSTNARNIVTKTPSFTSARERKAAGKKSAAKDKTRKKRKKK